jgi:hypothetical protein
MQLVKLPNILRPVALVEPGSRPLNPENTTQRKREQRGQGTTAPHNSSFLAFFSCRDCVPVLLLPVTKKLLFLLCASAASSLPFQKLRSETQSQPPHWLPSPKHSPLIGPYWPRSERAQKFKFVKARGYFFFSKKSSVCLCPSVLICRFKGQVKGQGQGVNTHLGHWAEFNVSYFLSLRPVHV